MGHVSKWLAEIVEAYDREAPVLAASYEKAKLQFAEPWWTQALPPAPALVLDVGAGTGLDAAWLASHGYEVVAVEPSTGMADVARSNGSPASISWVVDSLPDLIVIRNNNAVFDFILCNGVLQHVPPPLLQNAIASLADLIKPTCACAVSLRIGRLDARRAMFRLDPEDFCSFATNSGFTVESKSSYADPLDRVDVSWVMLTLRRDANHR